jgi:hypothetical protein
VSRRPPKSTGITQAPAKVRHHASRRRDVSRERREVGQVERRRSWRSSEGARAVDAPPSRPFRRNSNDRAATRSASGTARPPTSAERPWPADRARAVRPGGGDPVRTARPPRPHPSAAQSGRGARYVPGAARDPVSCSGDARTGDRKARRCAGVLSQPPRGPRKLRAASMRRYLPQIRSIEDVPWSWTRQPLLVHVGAHSPTEATFHAATAACAAPFFMRPATAAYAAVQSAASSGLQSSPAVSASAASKHSPTQSYISSVTP